MKRDVPIVLGAFVGVTLLAELLGAENFGTALAFGQIAFMAAVVFVILRSSRSSPAEPDAPPAPRRSRPSGAPPAHPRRRKR